MSAPQDFTELLLQSIPDEAPSRTESPATVAPSVADQVSSASRTTTAEDLEYVAPAGSRRWGPSQEEIDYWENSSTHSRVAQQMRYMCSATPPA